MTNEDRAFKRIVIALLMLILKRSLWGSSSGKPTEEESAFMEIATEYQKELRTDNA